MKEYLKIQVKEIENKKLEIFNPTEYPLVGQGSQGAVFKLDSQRCIKVYGNRKIAEMEKGAYAKGAGASFMPILYETGPLYIIIEYIEGPNLKEYLKKKTKMPLWLARELVNMLRQMRQYGFLRKDESLRHILIKEEQSIKIVDHVYAFSLKNPYPVKLFTQLDDLGRLWELLYQLERQDRELFEELKKAMKDYF